MKTLIAIALYAIVSGLLGLVVVGWLLWMKKTRAAGVAALIFFAGPVLTYIGIYIRDTIELQNFKEDVVYVRELCKKYGGDKIYKTVDNVEGVFQMKARNPDPDKQWRDQFGMIDPWGANQLDRSDMTQLLSSQRLSSSPGYIFYEQQPPYGQPEGPPFRRFYLKTTGKKVGDKYPTARNKDDPELEIVEEQVPRLASRYGYLMEDLTNREMRKRWVAGGRIKIIDLQTNEVLAERTGYFRASGPQYQMAWSGVQGVAHRCPMQGDVYEFLPKVLKPIAYQPAPLLFKSN